MLYEYIRIAKQSIKAARFRSFLTMVGVVIAVASVVTTASLGEGLKRQVSGQAGSAGDDLITVRPGQVVNRNQDGGVSGINLLSFLSSSSINENDYNVIKNDSNIKTAVPLSIVNGSVSNGDEQYKNATVIATNEDLPSVVSNQIEFGNFFSSTESDRNVAVIGQEVAERLFHENVPVSKTMKIRGQDFVVSGVFERARTNPINPEADYNNAVFIPYQSAKDLTGSSLNSYEVLARPNSKEPAKVDQAIASINGGLKNNHGGQEDFTVLRQKDVSSLADSLSGTVTKTVAMMAAIVLVVGGIGIMNVMLVSVTERTREIGIRKSVGATNSQIRYQFTVEAVVLSLWGAIAGVFLSFLINLGFRIFTDIQPFITWQAVLLSSLSSIVIGIVFGMIPAFKASRKDPIEALRSN